MTVFALQQALKYNRRHVEIDVTHQKSKHQKNLNLKEGDQATKLYLYT